MKENRHRTERRSEIKVKMAVFRKVCKYATLVAQQFPNCDQWTAGWIDCAGFNSLFPAAKLH